MFTDGSRLDDGATGARLWKNGQTWKGIKTHMDYNQEAYDAECTALARALESASRRNMTPERITIFTDAQAAIDGWRRTNLAWDSSTLSRRKGTSLHCTGPGRASSSKSSSAQLTRGSLAMRRPTSELRLRRRSQTPTGWNGRTTSIGQKCGRCPPPRSLANLKREISRRSG